MQDLLEERGYMSKAKAMRELELTCSDVAFINHLR